MNNPYRDYHANFAKRQNRIEQPKPQFAIVSIGLALGQKIFVEKGEWNKIVENALLLHKENMDTVCDIIVSMNGQDHLVFQCGNRNGE